MLLICPFCVFVGALCCQCANVQLRLCTTTADQIPHILVTRHQCLFCVQMPNIVGLMLINLTIQVCFSFSALLYT